MGNGKMWQTEGMTETRNKPDNRDKFSKKGKMKGNRDRRILNEDIEELESLGLTASQFRAVMGSDD